MAGHVLAVDLGTTATKSMLVDAHGNVIGEHTCASELRSPHPGYAEMDADTWWGHICQSVPALLAGCGVTASDIAVVAVSGMVPTLIPVDASGRALRPSIQQNDARAVSEIELLRDLVEDPVSRTGSAITAQSIAPKWMWLRRHEPQVTDHAAAILGSYGFAVQRLTGEMTAESNWSLESGLRSIDGIWAPDIADAAGLDPSLLPRQVRSDEIVGAVSGTAAAATGLRAGTPVIGGCADHVASAFAAGLAEPGDLLLKLGGAGDILLVVDGPVVDERLFLDHHPTPGRWLSNGCMASSGSLLRWFERELAAGTALARLDDESAGVAPTADGVLVLPYFLGEKTPLQDPLARGTIAGLHLGHTRAHLYRAVLEAVAFGFEHHLEVFRELGLTIGTARVTNGGSRSTLWKQVLADVTGLELHVPDIAHGSAYGTALVAGASVGLFDVNDVLRRSTASTVITPNTTHHQALHRHYQTWRRLEHAVRPISHDISKEHT